MYACFNNNLKVIKYLVEEVLINTSVVNLKNDNAFMAACKGNNKDVLKYLVDTVSTDFNNVNICGSNGLVHACHNNNLDVIKYLILELKMDVNFISGSNINILAIAIRFNKNPLIIKFLLSIVNNFHIEEIINKNMLYINTPCKDNKCFSIDDDCIDYIFEIIDYSKNNYINSLNIIFQFIIKSRIKNTIIQRKYI